MTTTAPATSAARLPAPLTSFIGRDREVAGVGTLLRANRLVTVTGAGGCGKTRLALEVAGTAPLPARFVDLAPVADGEEVGAAVASALGVDVRRTQATVDAVADAVADVPLLLVLDNCEHVVDVAASLAVELLGRCRELRILATSRERLAVAGEVTVRVPSLALPPQTDAAATVEALLDVEAVQLFVARARLVQPQFELSDLNASAVVDICRSLDGIPLAIELAAARTSTLSPVQIAAGLGDSLRLLTGGARTAVPRQQTLRASIEWSVRDLDEAHRTVLRRLAAFSGGWTLEAAEEVAEFAPIAAGSVLDLLSALVDRSLVTTVVDPGAGTVRFRLLEIVRQYASELLTAAGEQPAVMERHARHFRRLLDDAQAHATEPDQQAWRSRVTAEMDNLRGALHALHLSGAGTELLDLVCALGTTWAILGRYAEQRQWLELALDVAPDTARQRAAATYQLGNARMVDDIHAGLALLERAVDLALEHGQPSEALWSLIEVAGALVITGRRDDAMATYDRADAMATEIRDATAQAYARLHRGNTLVLAGWMAEGRRLLEASVADSSSPVEHHVRWGRLALGIASATQGELGAARAQLEPLLARTPPDDAVTLTQAPIGLALALAHGGETERAVELLRAATARSVEVGFEFVPATVLGVVLLLAGDRDGALIALEHAYGLVEGMSPATSLQIASPLAEAWMAAGEHDRAAAVLGDGGEEARSRNTVGPAFVALATTTCARLALRRDDLARAAALARAALVTHVEEAMTGGAIDCLEILGAVASINGRAADAARLWGAASGQRSRSGTLRRMPHDREWFDPAIDRARMALGAAHFDAAWAAGEALSLVEAAAAVPAPTAVPRPTSGWDSLTAAEHRVVALVAEGLTNVQIGERLFISRHTVDSHLRHVFSKIGVASRVELAARWRRRVMTGPDGSQMLRP